MLDTILSRRSIRRYTEEAVNDDQIDSILRAAMSAPSAGNSQPWQFVVITDRTILQEIPKFHQYSAMLKEAPCAILVCGDQRQAKFKGAYWVQDCAAATQNILLAAHSLGLGSVWLGVYPDEKRVSGLRELLKIPDDVIPFALVALGHPAEHKGPSERFDRSRIHRNGW